jgi:hypothetical protein
VANFATIAFVDTFALIGSLERRMGLFKSEADNPGHRILRLRGTAKGAEEADDRFGAYAAAQKWPELGNLRASIERKAEVILPPGIEFGRISMEMLDPGAMLDWHAELSPYFERWTRAILPLRTNPATLLICGTETASPTAGWFTIISPRLPSAAINLGEHGWVWLQIDFRKKATE